MGRDWIKIGDNSIGNGVPETKDQKTKRLKRANNLIRNTKSLSYEDLVIAGNEHYEKVLQNENRLIELVDSGKVTKKELVEQVAAIKKSREKRKNKKSTKQE